MAKKKTVVPFNGTKEQEAQLAAVIERSKDIPGALMPVLQEAQQIYGYLPIEVQIMIAEGMGVSLSEVYGVVTFYSQFSLNPKGQYPIGVCLGTACYVRGGKRIVERLRELLKVEVGDTTADGLFTLEVARCIGACGLAPAMSIDDTVYKRVNPDHLEHILAQYAPEKEGEAV